MGRCFYCVEAFPSYTDQTISHLRLMTLPTIIMKTCVWQKVNWTVNIPIQKPLKNTLLARYDAVGILSKDIAVESICLVLSTNARTSNARFIGTSFKAILIVVHTAQDLRFMELVVSLNGTVGSPAVGTSNTKWNYLWIQYFWMKQLRLCLEVPTGVAILHELERYGSDGAGLVFTAFLLDFWSSENDHLELWWFYNLKVMPWWSSLCLAIKRWSLPNRQRRRRCDRGFW